MRSTFKVLFYVKKGSEKPNGNLPLMCRITVDGEIKQFSCKMDVPLRLWDVKNNIVSTLLRKSDAPMRLLSIHRLNFISSTFCEIFSKSQKKSNVWFVSFS